MSARYLVGNTVILLLIQLAAPLISRIFILCTIWSNKARGTEGPPRNIRDNYARECCTMYVLLLL